MSVKDKKLQSEIEKIKKSKYKMIKGNEYEEDAHRKFMDIIFQTKRIDRLLTEINATKSFRKALSDYIK